MAALLAAETTQPVELTTQYVRFVVDPNAAGTITQLGFIAKPHNLAAAGGLLQEGFGVGNDYVPNRRLNERLEVEPATAAGTVLRYQYDCDGPNIQGLHATRVMEIAPGEASMRVTWTVENRGDKTQWIAPWVRNDVAPGGAIDAADRLDLPTTNGIENPPVTRFAPAARNWAAATDPAAQETVYAVFNANQLHSLQSIVEREDGVLGFAAWFVPGLIKPGETWKTVYRISAVRGLSKVDFATDELAAQLTYETGALKLLMSPSETIGVAEIHASVLRDEPTRLGAKRFTLAPDNLVRCTYAWRPAQPGPYEFLAELRRNNQPIELGRDCAPPHGGIDTQFVVENRAANRFEPWTDAPHLLDSGPRKLAVRLAAASPAPMWFESSLTKLLPADVPVASGEPEPRRTLVLARNESESFQLVLRPDTRLEDVRVQLGPLRLQGGDAGVFSERASGSAPPTVEIARVGYVPVRVPTHFEHPTGDYPDPLLPFERFNAPAGVCTSVWFTVHAPADATPGVYRAAIELSAGGDLPAVLQLEVEVLDFRLPLRPALRTDFEFSLDDAMRMAQARGYKGSRGDLARRYLENAAAHRVTLRQLAQLPAPGPAFSAEFQGYIKRLPDLRAAGVTTMAIQRELLDTPDRLRAVQSFAEREGLLDTIFCDFAFEPPRHAWPLVQNKFNEWQVVAPKLPLMISTEGIDPYLDPSFPLINVHTRVFDTAHNETLLPRIKDGREVWWYVNAGPPRPYANFFVEFAGVEHRVLFWQSWALGVRGLHYSGVNVIAPGQDPFGGLLDATPSNGNHFLIYPGPDGPVNSVRWEIIRDGIEDYDYLTLLVDGLRRLRERGGHEALVERAASALDIKQLVPDLVSFSRDAAAYERKREEIGRRIVEVKDAVAN